MRHGIAALSDREKQVLRLLVEGHEAKSIASELSLSVHTVNEYLREARRKLEVPSSREAARLLAASEKCDPEKIGNEKMGVGSEALLGATVRPSEAPHRLVSPVAGVIVMLIVVGAVAALVAANASQSPTSIQRGPATMSQSDAAELSFARDWVALLDKQNWKGSWTGAGTILKSRMPEANWASTIQPVRGPLGAVLSRKVYRVTAATSLPGAPDGDYQIVQFQTEFAQKKDAIETVVLAHEGASWKVDGYFIK